MSYNNGGPSATQLDQSSHLRRSSAIRRDHSTDASLRRTTAATAQSITDDQTPCRWIKARGQHQCDVGCIYAVAAGGEAV